MARGKNYTLGRGKLYADFYDTNGNLTGEFYIGNTTSLTYSSDEDVLDHFDSDDGVREKDDTVQLSDTATIGFTTDDIQPENLATFIKGEVTTLTTMAATGETEDLIVLRARYYQLGASDASPTGVRAIENVEVEVTTPAVQATGNITILTAAPAANDTVTIGGNVITFVTSGATGAQVLRGASAAEAAANLRVYVNAHPALLVSAGGSGGEVDLVALTGGTAGNSITLAKSFATSGNATVSGANLTGGAASSSAAADADDYTVDADLGRLYIKEDAAGIADGDTVTVTYDIQASTRSVVLSTGDKATAALRYVAANPKGPQRDHYWPKVVVSPDGDYELKGDDWQAMSFSGEALKVTGRAKHYIDGRAVVA